MICMIFSLTLAQPQDFSSECRVLDLIDGKRSSTGYYVITARDSECDSEFKRIMSLILGCYTSLRSFKDRETAPTGLDVWWLCTVTNYSTLDGADDGGREHKCSSQLSLSSILRIM